MHGHQSRSGKFNDWWKGPGLEALADRHYAVTGHYHFVVFEPAGWLDGLSAIVQGLRPWTTARVVENL